MKHFQSITILLLLFALSLSGCEIIGDIFAAGFWVGIIVVIAVIALIVWLVTKVRT